MWLTGRPSDGLIYCVVRKVKGLEIGPWEWRKKIKRGTETEEKVLNCNCDVVVASLALLT